MLTGLGERLGGDHHRRSDPLRVAGTASGEMRTSSRRADEGWNGVQMRGKGDGAESARCPDVGVTGGKLLVRDSPASLAQPRCSELDGWSFSSCERRLSDQRMREVDDVGHRHNLSQPLLEGETVRAPRVYDGSSKGTSSGEKKREKVLTTRRRSTNFLLPNKTRITALTPILGDTTSPNRYLFAGNDLSWLTSTAFQR